MAKTNRSAGGIGESQVFAVPDAERTEPNVVDRMLGCHINGVLVSELKLDEQVLHALDYYATDEGIAEKNARDNVRESSGVSIGKEPFEKALDQRRNDVIERDMPIYEARDPMKEVADKYAVAGMKPKFLSRSRIKDAGGTTGAYTVVVDANGDPVQVKGMILGLAPVDVVEARNKHYRAKGNQLLKQIGEKHLRENANDKSLVDQQ